MNILSSDYLLWLTVFRQYQNQREKTTLLRALLWEYNELLGQLFIKHQENIHPFRKEVQSALYKEGEGSMLPALREYDLRTKKLWEKFEEELAQARSEWTQTLERF